MTKADRKVLEEAVKWHKEQAEYWWAWSKTAHPSSNKHSLLRMHHRYANAIVGFAAEYDKKKARGK